MSLRDCGSRDQSRTPIERVQNHVLPERTRGLVDAYDDVVGDRSRFLWKWAHYLFPKIRLSSVEDAEKGRLQDNKLVALMYVSILDDVGEMHQNRPTFEEAAKIPFDHQTVNFDRDGVDEEVVRFAGEVWELFSPTIEDGPRANEFEDIVEFDLKQVLNAIDYSYVANKNMEMVNQSEFQNYEAHNMMLFVFADVDLIHSPAFELSELARFREVLTHAQQMVRIGNWITTWEREISEADFSSGIVAHALETDVVTVEQLRTSRTSPAATESIVESIRENEVEEVFLDRWEDELAAAREIEDSFDTVDARSFLDGIETVMDYHLASRGLK